MRVNAENPPTLDPRQKEIVDPTRSYAVIFGETGLWI